MPLNRIPINIQTVKSFTKTISIDLGRVFVITFKEKKLNDEVVVQQIFSHLFSLIEIEKEMKKCILDFTNIECIDETTIGKLTAMDTKIDRVSGRMIICNICESIMEKMTLMKLDKILLIAKDQEDALLKMAEPRPREDLSIQERTKLACAKELRRDPKTILSAAIKEGQIEVTLVIPVTTPNGWIDRKLSQE